MAGSLKVCGRKQKNTVVKETSLCGGVKELNLERKVGHPREWSQCFLQLGACSEGTLQSIGVTISPDYPQACAPLWSRACGSSVFSSGICAHVDASFQPQGSLAPTAQREPEEEPKDSVPIKRCWVGKRWAKRSDVWQRVCMAILVAT